MTFGANLKSSKLGKKAIIKIWDKFLEDDEVNKLALVAPSAKINIIRDYDVVEKKTVNVPEKVEGIVKCMNPKCITNHEKVRTKFTDRPEMSLLRKIDRSGTYGNELKS